MTKGDMDMSHQEFKLREAESVEIISLIENSVDYLSTIQKDEVKNVREWTKRRFIMPIAEHGFSVLLRVYDGYKLHSVLFDVGSSPNGVVTNAKRMGMRARRWNKSGC
jgi:metal-dependent hydrolase (beta-lactamase superfamily II)